MTRPDPDAVVPDDPQVTGQRLALEDIHAPLEEADDGVTVQTSRAQNDESGVGGGEEGPDIGEIKAEGDEGAPLFATDLRDSVVRGALQGLIVDRQNIEAGRPEEVAGIKRQVFVELERVHAEIGSGRVRASSIAAAYPSAENTSSEVRLG